MIDKHVEKEYKMMITKDIYFDLIKQYQLTAFKQTNYYYKSNNSKIAMRIRSIEDAYYFTLKVDQIDHKDEYEFPIQEHSLNDSRITELLNHFKITNPEYLGEMTTNRAILKLDCGEICLDHSLYLNTEDYELEYELYDYLKENEEFKEFLKKNNLTYIKSKRSKFGRFIDEKSRNLNA